MKVHDRVKITDAMDPDWIGKFGNITRITRDGYIELDIYGGHWRPSQLQVVSKEENDTFGKPHGYDWY